MHEVNNQDTVDTHKIQPPKYWKHRNTPNQQKDQITHSDFCSLQ